MKEEKEVIAAVPLSQDDLAWHLTPYESHDFAEDLIVTGIAWNHDRVWFHVNGLSVFRAKVIDGKLTVEYNKPDSIKETTR